MDLEKTLQEFIANEIVKLDKDNNLTEDFRDLVRESLIKTALISRVVGEIKGLERGRDMIIGRQINFFKVI